MLAKQFVHSHAESALTQQAAEGVLWKNIAIRQQLCKSTFGMKCTLPDSHLHQSPEAMKSHSMPIQVQQCSGKEVALQEPKPARRCTFLQEHSDSSLVTR